MRELTLSHDLTYPLMQCIPQKSQDTFWSKVDTSGDCWTWTGCLLRGYGQASLTRRFAGFPAHRLSWMLLVGEIAEGMQLDHLCRNRPCVNPDHLEPVTPAENTARAPRPNRQHYPNGARCKICVLRPGPLSDVLNDPNIGSPSAERRSAAFGFVVSDCTILWHRKGHPPRGPH